MTAAIPIIYIVEKTSDLLPQVHAAGVDETVEPPANPESIEALLRRHVAPPQVPAVVLDDPKRAAALRESRLLDSAAEDRFDRLMHLTTKLLGVPTALVSIVASDRQFFKSQVGLPDPWAARRQTPLSHSFCQWVVGGHEELVVTDARQHALLRSNLAVRDLSVIAYAGIPISAPTGEALGSFCAIDSKPRQWNEEQLEMLRDLSMIAQGYVTTGSTAANADAKRVAGDQALEAARRLSTRAPEAHRVETGRIVDDLEALFPERESDGH